MSRRATGEGRGACASRGGSRPCGPAAQPSFRTLVSDRHGRERGVDLARRLALAAVDARGSKPRSWFALASTYAELSTSEQEAAVAKLEKDDAEQEIRTALSPLLTFYPECPLRFLFADPPESEDDSLEKFKDILAPIFDRRDTPATFEQATAVYIAFCSGMLKVFKGLALANFSAIEKFPNTEESQHVASAARSTVSMFYEQFRTDNSAVWVSYFWRRGLELDDCMFETEIG